MGTIVTLNSTTYTIPATGESNWATPVSSYLIALSTGVLTKSGGSFPLTAVADFGANFGLKSLYFSGRTTPSSAGVVRLGASDSVGWRNAGNSADLLLNLSADKLTFNSNPVVTLANGASNTVLKMNAGGTAFEYGLLVNANVDSAAAIVYSKLNLTSSIVNADVSGSAAIAYSKLDLTTSIVNADVATAAAIARSKLASGTASHVVINDGSGVFSSEAQLAGTRGGTGISSTATYPASGVIVTEAATQTLTNKTLTSPLMQRLRLNDVQVSAAGPALAVQATVTTYRLQAGFGGTLTTVTGASDGDLILIINETGADLVVTNGAGVNAVKTGTAANISIKSAGSIILSFDSTNNNWNLIGGAGAGGLTAASQNGSFTAASGFNYLVDTSAAAITATLPSGAAGASIRFTDAEETWGNASRALTIAPASGQKIGQQAVNETLVMDVSGTWVELTWDSVNSWWTVAAPGATAGGAILQNGNSLGATMVLGTNDNFGLDFETNGTTKLGITSAGAVTLGPASGGGIHTIQAANGVATRVLNINNTTVSATDSLVAYLTEGTARGFLGADTANCFKVIGSAGGSSVRMFITDAGAVTLPLIHNLGAGNILSGQTAGSIVAGTNVTGLTSNGLLWTRVGNIVTVSYRAIFSVTSAGVQSSITITLPVASDLITSADLYGSGTVIVSGGAVSANSEAAAFVGPDLAANTAQPVFRTATTGASHIIAGTFQYVVK